MTLITSRRSFITGLVALVAAPAIVRASSLMPVKDWREGFSPLSAEELLRLWMAEAYRITKEGLEQSLYGVSGWGPVQTYPLDRQFRDGFIPHLDAIMNHTRAKVCFEPGTAVASSWQLTPNRNGVT